MKVVAITLVLCLTIAVVLAAAAQSDDPAANCIVCETACAVKCEAQFQKCPLDLKYCNTKECPVDCKPYCKPLDSFIFPEIIFFIFVKVKMQTPHSQNKWQEYSRAITPNHPNKLNTDSIMHAAVPR